MVLVYEKHSGDDAREGCSLLSPPDADIIWQKSRHTSRSEAMAPAAALAEVATGRACNQVAGRTPKPSDKAGVLEDQTAATIRADGLARAVALQPVRIRSRQHPGRLFFFEREGRLV